MDDQQLAELVVVGGRMRALLLELWQRTRIDWGFVTDRLASTFRKETWVGSHDRRFISETLYGMVRHLRRIDLALERARKTKRAPKDLERLLALLVLEKLITPARAARVEPGLDWNAVAGVDDAIAQIRKPVERIALAASLPDWLANRILADWGDEGEALAMALNQRAPMTVRTNLLVNDRESLGDELRRSSIQTHEGKWSDTALVVDSRTNLFATDAFGRGALEVQDEGSQLLADVALAAVPDAKLVVDMCAGAGGKTLAMAGRMKNRGRIVASDIDVHKLGELKRRARRATVSNAQVIELDKDTGRWPAPLDALRAKADLVLVDAPCSGIGALRRNPEARWRMRESDLADFAKKQKEILANAIELAAPGGTIVYATCTVLKVENQEVIASAPGVTPTPLRDVLGETRAKQLGDGESLLVTPHRHGTDGFFAHVLKRL